MRMTRVALALHLILLPSLSAGSLSAQDARLTQRLDASAARAVQVLVDSARALGLPTEPVVQKALQGASMGASADNIVAAARGFVVDLSRARRAFGADAAQDALVLGAAALDAGLTDDQLQTLRRHRERRSFSGALAGVIYLVTRDVPPQESLSLVDAMLNAGLSTTEFISLQRLVEQDVRGGAAPAEAASVRGRALIRHGGRLGPGGSLP